VTQEQILRKRDALLAQSPEARDILRGSLDRNIRHSAVPKWGFGELTPDPPCPRQPSLHRIVANCPPEKDAILDLAGRYGLLTVSITQRRPS
jgi:hypothetical protein